LLRSAELIDYIYSASKDRRSFAASSFACTCEDEQLPERGWGRGGGGTLVDDEPMAIGADERDRAPRSPLHHHSLWHFYKELLCLERSRAKKGKERKERKEKIESKREEEGGRRNVW
jgi:hypothetical protein